MDVNKAEVARYVVQMQNGDGQAFEKLYNATNQSGYFTALKIVKDEDEAQDVLQDSYIKVLERIKDIQNPESFVSWFHQIVANTAKNYLVKKKPSLFASDDEEQEYTEFIPDEDEVWQPEKNVDEDDVRRQVMQIIEGLTDEKRTCVLLYYYNEMSVADIAASVGASENTVKARLFQARKDIRKEVEKLGAKNITLRGVAPISLVLWALRMASKADGAKFAAGPAAAVMEGAAAAASSGAVVSGAAAGTAAAGAAQTAAAAGSGLAAKIAAMTVAQKVIAGIVTTAVVAGAATGTAAVVNNAKEETTTEPSTEAVEAFAEVTTADVLESIVTFTDEEKMTTEPETVKNETVTEPIATTAAPTTTTQAEQTASDTASSVSAKPSVTSAAQTANTTTKAETTTKPTTTKPTATTTTTTTKPTTAATTTTTTYTPSVTPQTSVTTTTTATTTTTEKVKGTATVNIKYSVADYDDSGSVSFTVEEGDAITEAMIESAVREKLSGTYSIDEISLRSGSPVDSAEATTYTYTVFVYVE